MEGSRNKQTGFSVIETLIVIVVIGLFAVDGWAVYQRYKPTAATNTTQTTNQQNSTTTTQTRTDPYASWKAYCDSTIKACIKHPSDWVASKYGGQENSACTEYASLTGSNPKDRGSDVAYIASIDVLSAASTDLKVVGTIVNDQPSYAVYNTSYLSQNNIQVGATQSIADINYTFTGKTGDAALVGTPCANGYAAISTLDQAKAWFNTTEGKTVLSVVQSFYYQ